MSTYDHRRKEISDFYREEFLRHKSRLQTQKTFFTDETYVEIEAVLSKIIDDIDKISPVLIFNTTIDPALCFSNSKYVNFWRR